MLRIRLSRVGKRKQPAYRLVVADSRSPRDGSFLKIIGHYNPLTNPATVTVKEDEAVYWLQKGAQPSETAAKLLTRVGVMERAGRAPVRHQPKEAPAAPKKPVAKRRKPAPAAEATSGEAKPGAEPEATAEEPAAEAAPEEPAAEAVETQAESEAAESEPAAEPEPTE